MRRRCVPSEQSEHFRPFNFVPADPDHSKVEVAQARERLKSYDSFLNVWWSPMRGFHSPPPVGRWRIVCWCPNTGNWDHVDYWEGAGGEYRLPQADAMLNRVCELDQWRVGETVKTVSDRIDAANERRREKAKRDAHDEAIKESTSFAEIMSGQKKHFDTKSRLVLP